MVWQKEYKFYLIIKEYDILIKYSGENKKNMIRNVQLKDAKEIANIYRYYVEETVISFDICAPSVTEMENRITRYTKKYPWLVYELNGKIVGYAYANQFKKKVAYDSTVEISIYIHKDFCSKGYGNEILRALLKQLNDYPYYMAIACITYPNEKSQRLFKKLGFKYVGQYNNVGRKFDQWLSVVDYELQIKELTINNLL